MHDENGSDAELHSSLFVNASARRLHLVKMMRISNKIQKGKTKKKKQKKREREKKDTKRVFAAACHKNSCPVRLAIGFALRASVAS